ncbi:MAG TPA: helix-turn-helix domain-containing protein [Caulobacter sp.]|nr:helix-turn-helix domain-containing protein [Caulobacter sp.]
MQWDELEGQACSIARTMSVIGDRWTIMILRDCFLRVRRFDDFHARLGIGRPILSDRLNKLIDAFILTKVAYQTKPLRYEYRLTQKGLDLYPMMLAIAHWGDVHMSGKKGRPLLHHHVTCNHQFDPVTVCSECSEVVYPRDVRNILGPGARDPQHMPAELAESMRRKPARAKVPDGEVSSPAKGGGRASKEPSAA